MSSSLGSVLGNNRWPLLAAIAVPLGNVMLEQTSSREKILLASIVGAVSIKVIQTIARSCSRKAPLQLKRTLVEEEDFAYFDLDIRPFKSVGKFSNSCLLAHKYSSIADEKICRTLREMDAEEYEFIKAEHPIAIRIENLQDPRRAHLMSAGTSIFYSYIAPRFFYIPKLIKYIAPALSHGFVSWISSENSQQAIENLDANRESRLNKKMEKLTKRMEVLKSKKKGPLEVKQLEKVWISFTAVLNK